MKVVILAGGGGTRLWPLSTDDCPKQFQKLTSDKTMLHETIDRLDFLNKEDIFIAINIKHKELVQKNYPQIPSKNILIEPALRDTAPCIGLATAMIEKKYPGETVVIIYADHLIKNKKEFQKKIRLAEKIVDKENTLNIVEVAAKDPNTNYGYVKIGKRISQDVYEIDKFVEKPDKKTATSYVKSKKYLWNTGLYVWKAKTLLEKYRKFKPEMYKKIMEMVGNSKKTNSLYPKLEKISIDYAIMEKVNPKDIRIIKADLGWSDIGNWDAVFSELSAKKTHNITRGETELIDCKGCLVYSDDNKKIAAVGLKDIIIVDSPNGLLIGHKKNIHKVKEIKKIAEI